MKLIYRKQMLVTFLLAPLLYVGAVQWQAQEARASQKSAQDVTFWETVTLHGSSEVQRFDSLDEMVKASDVVVRGKFTNFRVSRYIQGDTADDVVPYGAADFIVAETIRGNRAGEVIPVEFVLGMSAEEARQAVNLAVLPSDDVVAMLRRKRGAKDAPYFRLTTSAGAWISTDSGVTAPLSPGESHEEPIAGDLDRPAAQNLPPEVIQRRRVSEASHGSDSASHAAHVRYAAELRGVKSLADLAAKLRR